MADQALKDQFFQALQRSKSFLSLSPENQAEIKQSFQDADDETLREALEELQKHDAAAAQRQAEAKKRNEELMKEATDIKNELKEIEKVELREKSEKDAQDSSKDADALIAELEKEEEKPKPKKRKKWFGLF